APRRAGGTARRLHRNFTGHALCTADGCGRPREPGLRGEQLRWRHCDPAMTGVSRNRLLCGAKLRYGTMPCAPGWPDGIEPEDGSTHIDAIATALFAAELDPAHWEKTCRN